MGLGRWQAPRRGWRVAGGGVSLSGAAECGGFGVLTALGILLAAFVLNFGVTQGRNCERLGRLGDAGI